jgi:hypothetical protein
VFVENVRQIGGFGLDRAVAIERTGKGRCKGLLN